MSVVERALKNLKKRAAADAADAAGQQQSIARLAERAAAGAAESVALPDEFAPHKRIEFDLDVLKDAGLYATGNERLADECRLIKQPLLKAALGQGAAELRRPNLLMIASALPGEGKTFTSVNLSMSFAREKDWSVLLVDVDCRNPQLSRLLGVDGEPGLLDLLRDRSQSLDALILATNIDGLCMLPVGTGGDDAAELLRSARMGAVCDSLSQAARKQLVVFDSSPVLVSSEASILSSQVGQVVFVVLANKTPQQAVVEAVGKVDPAAAMGLVLNGIDQESEAFRYGGYYGYGASGSRS